MRDRLLVLALGLLALGCVSATDDDDSSGTGDVSWSGNNGAQYELQTLHLDSGESGDVCDLVAWQVWQCVRDDNGWHEACNDVTAEFSLCDGCLCNKPPNWDDFGALEAGPTGLTIVTWHPI